MKGFSVAEEECRPSILRFDLDLTDMYAQWKGKLIVRWPPPERSWWRRAHRNEMPVLAILEDSALDAAMPRWDEMVLTWEQLGVLPKRWKSVLSQWRAIYYIFDLSDGKGYVGSAYSDRGNSLLRKRDPQNFRFTILQRVSPDMDADDVIRLENTWKNRLHTRAPSGLNDN